jgi:hypothetical protein
MSDTTGNRKPPEEHQFKKGVSGNPRGRPRRSDKRDEEQSLSLTRIVNQALAQEVEIRERGRAVKVPIIKLVISKALHVAAKSGDVKLLDQTMKLAEKLDRAALQGLTQEPLVIRVIGGLPDNDPPPPPTANFDDE